MNVPNHILVPTDFSDTAGKALDLAIDIAEKLGARITVMHAYEIPFVSFPDGVLMASAELASRVLNGAQEALDKIVADRKSRGVSLTGLLKNDDPRSSVLTVAKEIGADLIVMGTHGRQGLAHVLLGSITEYVVRTSPVPVLTVRG